MSLVIGLALIGAIINESHHFSLYTALFSANWEAFSNMFLDKTLPLNLLIAIASVFIVQVTLRYHNFMLNKIEII